MRIKSNLQAAEFEELVRPKLKLFMSVDIVGSTHFKQRESKGPNQNWLNLFISFFTEFPSRLNSEIVGLDADLPPVRLWKSLGDELIFTVRLERRQHALLYVKALSRALRKEARNWHTNAQEPDRKELHLKGAAWLVGFPVGNVEIPLVSSGTSDETGRAVHGDDRDYIGPLVDMGFRLKEHASSRRLVIAADLAYLMLATGVAGDMALFYEGDVPLKGVLRGKAYPVVWLDCDGHPEADDEGNSSKMNRLKDKLDGRNPTNHSDLQTYLKLWLLSVKDSLCIPFIKDDTSEDFTPGSDYDLRHQEAVASLKKIFYDAGPAVEDASGSARVPSEVSSLIAKIQGLPAVKKTPTKKTAARKKAPNAARKR